MAAFRNRGGRVVLGLLALLVIVGITTTGAQAQRGQGGPGGQQQQSREVPLPPKMTAPEGWINTLRWRSIGPANMSGRIVDLAINEKDPTNWWAATASGGLLKTTNDGFSFEHQFDRETTVSIGAMDISQSNPDIVWVGTGEENPRNSSSYGDGVYKSTDGGKTWTNMGLKGIFQTGAVCIHPTNPDIVYIGALGRLWGTNEERGLFKTTDSGKTWEKILYIDEKTGVIDVQMHPENPDEFLVATYERQRDGFDGNDPEKKWGSGSGIYRTTDGGKTFVKVTKGLPTINMGRIGLDYYCKDPNVVYAVIETEWTGAWSAKVAYLGANGENADVGARITNLADEGPAAKAGLKTGDIVIEFNGKKVLSYGDLLAEVRKKEAGDEVTLQVARAGEVVEVKVTFDKRPDIEDPEGAMPSREDSPFAGSLGGQEPNLHEQQGEEGFQYGGVYRSTDGGVSWERINSLNPRPMYYSKVKVDPSDSNYVYVLGTLLYKSNDGGKTFTDDGHGGEVHVDHHALWIDGRDGRHIILGNDGGIYITRDRMESWDHLNHVAIGQFYHVGVGPQADYRAAGGLQDNGTWAGPTMVRNDRGPVNTDWFRVGGGDGFVTTFDPNDPDRIYFESQNGGMGRMHLHTGERGFLRPRAPRGTEYRFNWKTPYILSNYNSRVFYSAGNYVFRSVDRGNNMQPISPEITRTKNGAGSAIGESRFDQNVLYVGTTDGALVMTGDGGTTWTDLWSGEEVKPKEPEAEAEGGDGEGAGGGAAGGGAGRGPRGGGGQVGAMLSRLDANSDGKLERSEVPERMQQMFDRFDTNSDGVISAEEIEAAAARSGGAGQRPAAVPDGAIGSWQIKLLGDGIPDESREFELTLSRGERGAVSGTAKSAVLDGTTDSVQFDAEKNELQVVLTTNMGRMEIAGVIDGNAMKGTVLAGGGLLKIQFEATKNDGEPLASAASDERTIIEPGLSPGGEVIVARAVTVALIDDDVIAGEWAGRILSEEVPPGAGAFTVIINRSGTTLSGSVQSQAGGGEYTNGTFNAETGDFKFTISSPQGAIDFAGKLVDGKITGTLSAGGGQFEVGFEMTRTKAYPAPEQAAPARQEAAQPQRPQQQRRERPAPAADEGGAKPISELLPKPMWVSSIEPSRHVRGRVYITIDGHRSDDDACYALASEDDGKTWRLMSKDLPRGSARVIREDFENPNVLYLGTEFAAWVSIDRGQTWAKFNSNLPTVAVHELAQHATRGEMVAGTHGRSLWVLDVTPVRQFTKDALEDRATLMRPNTAIRWRRLPSRGDSGTRQFVGENPPDGAQVFYALTSNAGDVTLRIEDVTGRLIREYEDIPTSPGLHMIEWDLRRQVRGGGGRFRRGPMVDAGTYRVVLHVDDDTFIQPLIVVEDPEYLSVPLDATGVFTADEFIELDEFEAMFGDDEEHGGGDGDRD